MVAIGWDGFNGQAEFYKKNADDSRWKKHGFELPEWRQIDDGYILVCGEFRDARSWYNKLKVDLAGEDVRFRPHPFVSDLHGWPQAPGKKQDDIETALAGAKVCLTWDSIAGCDAALAGVPSVTYGEKSMAWDVSKPTYQSWLNDPQMPDREQWCNEIAYCQWSHQEIEDGDFWEHLKQRNVH